MHSLSILHPSIAQSGYIDTMTENDKIEQRAVVKFLVLNNKTPSEVFDSLQKTYGPKALARTTVFRWHRWFSEGRSAIADASRSGRPASVVTKDYVLQVKAYLDHDRRITIREISESLDISVGLAQAIISKQLGMHRVWTYMVGVNMVC